MIELSDLILFLVAGLVLCLTPGPDMLYVAARSTSQGRRAGVVSALGIATGSLIHTTAAAAGLSALLATSSRAFEVVRWVGVAYLVYLGVRALVSSGGHTRVQAVNPASLWSVYREGVLVNVLNPKVALFFLSFLPQFVDPATGSVAVQLALLGALFSLSGAVVDISVALVFGSAGAWLRARPGVQRVQEWATGLTYIGLGVGLAFSKQR